MRKTCKEIQVNLAYRWFLGISMDEQVPNYSTWSQNYIRRYEPIAYGFVDMETVFGDCKEQHNMRYTRLRGVQKNQHQCSVPPKVGHIYFKLIIERIGVYIHLDLFEISLVGV